MLEHGGRLLDAAQRYGIAPADWLDLSTGIHPQPWPVPPIPAAAWQRLPEEGDGLEAAASAYYGSTQLLPVAGSQQAIQLLPRLFAPQRVALLTPLYNEHAQAWQRAGHVPVPCLDLDSAVAAANIVVLCNPNNPDGRLLTPAALRAAAAALAACDGWLVVDEAFMDATPQHSVAAAAGAELPNLIVLRSLGKFFGLAGARVGFVAAAPTIRAALREEIGPWPLAHPSRWIAQLALADTDWQRQARAALQAQTTALATVLQAHGTPSGCALFQYLPCHDAIDLQDALARTGILVRAFAQPAALRFGLPPAAAGLQRLQTTLARLHTP